MLRLSTEMLCKASRTLTIMRRSLYISGDTWSIGGKQPQTLTSPILGAGDGLSGSHNKYESDASPGRGDYYRELLALNAQLIADLHIVPQSI